nr:hypothetical protein [Salmonid herpesvirus 1]
MEKGNPWHTLARTMCLFDKNLGATTEEILQHIFVDCPVTDIPDGKPQLALGMLASDQIETVLKTAPVTWDVYFEIPEQFSKERVFQIISLGLRKMSIEYLMEDEKAREYVSDLKRADEMAAEQLVSTYLPEYQIPFTTTRGGVSMWRARVVTSNVVLLTIYWDEVEYCVGAKGYCTANLPTQPY